MPDLRLGKHGEYGDMPTILVTGGAGFIGSCFVRLWIADGAGSLVNLDKLTYAGNLDSLAAAAEIRSIVFVQGDIVDRRLVRQLLRKHRPRAIVNFAAESHVDRSIDGPGEFIRDERGRHVRVARAARAYWKELPARRARRFRFLQVSTDEVYGSLGRTGRSPRRRPTRPIRPTRASKAASDHLVRAYHHTYGLPVLMTNCSNNYGPYQFPEKLIPLMILNALEGKPLPVYGDGRTSATGCLSRTIAAPSAACWKRGRSGETYNIGGDCERANLTWSRQSVPRSTERLGRAACPLRTLIAFVGTGPVMIGATPSTRRRSNANWAGAGARDFRNGPGQDRRLVPGESRLDRARD